MIKDNAQNLSDHSADFIGNAKLSIDTNFGNHFNTNKSLLAYE